MARWVFKCSNCGAVIQHSTIPETVENYSQPAKPFVAEGGESMTCPNCKEIHIYKQEHLQYAS